MPAERTREHTAPLAAARRRRLRADRARQLADLLRHLVLTGGFPGGALPHEDVLAADYQVSRNTVRHALDLLRAEQLVERLPGVGTVVVAEKYPHGLDRLVMGLAESLRQPGRFTKVVDVDSFVDDAPLRRGYGGDHVEQFATAPMSSGTRSGSRATTAPAPSTRPPPC